MIITYCCTDLRWRHCHSHWAGSRKAADLFQQLYLSSSGQSVSATWPRKHFVWKHGETFSASSHIKCSLFCSRGRLQQRREGRMDESPTTITFISRLHRCEDASDPCQINWGLFSYETQTEGKVITMTFLTSLKQFLHLLVGPRGLLLTNNI